MNHPFCSLCENILQHVQDKRSQMNRFVLDVRRKDLADSISHLKSQANKLGLFIPSDCFPTNKTDQTCCLLTWLGGSLFISAINPKRKGHKAACTTAVMSSLWKCYPSALNPSATCCEKSRHAPQQTPSKTNKPPRCALIQYHRSGENCGKWKDRKDRVK